MATFLSERWIASRSDSLQFNDPLSWADRKEVISSSGNSSVPSFLWEDELARKLQEKLLVLESNRVLHPYGGVKLDTFQSEDVGSQMHSANPRFKTEICRNFKEKGTCLYGHLCQFAHGSHELRQDVVRHSKYKTKLCQKYWIAGYCAYGPRCNFIHQEIEKEQALRILAGMSTEPSNGGVSYKASNPFTMGYGDLLVRQNIFGIKKGGSTDSSGSDPDLSVQNAISSNGWAYRSPLDVNSCFKNALSFEEKSLSDLLPSNFGFNSEASLRKPFGSAESRRPIGSERLVTAGFQESVWPRIGDADKWLFASTD